MSADTLATGTPGGCTSSNDYGIQIKVRYQVKDQNGADIKSSAMEPQEKITDADFNGQPQPDPIPNWTDIGPTEVSGTSKFTNSIGQFIDAPLGACAAGTFTSTFKQEISVFVGGTNRFSVMINNFEVLSDATVRGLISNEADIDKQR